MVYELMHKDIVVAELEIENQGEIRKIIKVYNLEHFPFGTVPRKNNDPSGLKRWWQNRRIPLSRDDLEEFLNAVIPEEASTSHLLLYCHGLSLSDCYWIREKGASTSFYDINFFENEYSYDLGDILVGNGHADEVSSLCSPDATSEGNLVKRWKIIGGKRTLLKSGTKPNNYEVYNEVIASSICSHLNIPHVTYRIIKDNESIYCACEDFISCSQDFVTAYMIHEGGGKRNDESEYQFLLRRFEELGIEDAKKSLQQMLLVDYIIGNEDRHLNNFGLIRDSNTLKFMAMAPIFDTGSSLGFNMNDKALSSSRYRPWKPFSSNNHPTQLDYIDELPLDNVDALATLINAIEATLATFLEMPASRKKAIIHFISNRIYEINKKFGLVSKETDLLSKTQRAIIGYISMHGNRLDKAEDLSKSLQISKITALRNINELVRLGKIRRVGSKKTGHWEIV